MRTSAAEGDRRLVAFSSQHTVILAIGWPEARTRGLLGVAVRKDPVSARAGEDVTLNGAAFGDQSANGALLLDGAPTPTSGWTDTQITFKVPQVHPTSGAWSANGQVVQIGVITFGQNGANALPLTVKP